METWDIRTLKLEPHSPQVLRSDDDTRVIAMEIPSGEQLQEHEVHEHTHLLVVSGEVQIDRDSETVSGGPGLLAHFEPGERHSVKALSETRLVLLLSPWPGEGHPST